jgi:hypothetical protein
MATTAMLYKYSPLPSANPEQKNGIDPIIGRFSAFPSYGTKITAYSIRALLLGKKPCF